MPDIFSNNVKTTTQTRLVAKVVDQVLTDNAVLGRFVKKAKSGDGKFNGRMLELPVQTSKMGGFTFYQGAETFDRSVSDLNQKMQYDPKFANQSVTILGTEITMNHMADDNKMIDLIDMKLEQAQSALADNLGDAFYGDGNSYGGKAFLGLEALVDDGTNTSTIGGLSRTTYPSLKSTVTASGGTLTLSKLFTLYNNTKSGSIKPTVIVTTESVFSYLETLLVPALRYDDPSKYAIGAESLKFKGMEVMADEKCPSGVLYMLNENFIKFWTIKHPKAKPVPYADIIEGNNYTKETMGYGFAWKDFVQSYNQDVYAGDIFFGGVFTNVAPRFSGKLTGITGV